MRLVLACLLALWCRPGFAALDLAAATHRRVTSIEVENSSRVLDAEILDLLGLRPGQLYEPHAVQQGLTRLAQKVGIRDVLVLGREQGGGVALRLEVTPEPLIRSLGFRGNRVVADKDLASLVSTQVDRPVRQAALEQDAQAIQKRYAEEGYPATRAIARVTARSNPHWVDVTFQVDQGDPERVTAVEGSAEPAMDRARMLALLGLREGSPASRRRLREGVLKLREVLHRDGYPEARVGRARFRPADGGDGVVLVLPLEVGERVDVRVEDVDEWAAAPLRELIRGRYGETLDEDWAQKTAELAEEELRAQGYRDARVVPEFGEAYGVRRLVFRVDRGPKVRVVEVRFRGNDHLEADRLVRYMSLVEGGLLGSPPFTQEALERDLRVLGEYYASKGYLDAQVSVGELTVPPDGSALLQLNVDEGQKYRLGDVTFATDGALSVEEAAATAALEAGAPANPGRLEEVRVRLLRELEGRGYPKAEVSLETGKDEDAALLHAQYRLRGGPLVRFGKVVVSGNARTRTKVILRELAIREGDPWDPEQVRRSRQALYGLGFFHRVRIEPLPDGPK
ncbi:MAG: hypothetical protein IH608_09550, partial [Proteobacteria bacterium]|nr:hypothetical protein [Pseudomonadota bacterium]